MEELLLNIYGNTLSVVSNTPELIHNISRDFHYFRAHSIASPDFVIKSYQMSPLSLRTPRGLPWIKTKDFSCYEKRGIKKVFYEWGGVVILDYKRDIANVFSESLNRLYELVYTLLLSVIGEFIEKKGYHRIHALGVSRNGKGGLIIAPLGGGKTTLALKLLQRDEFKLVSEDTPLIDKHFFLHPFPLRLGVRPGTYLKIPAKYLRQFKRSKYGSKILIDIDFFKEKIERGKIPLSWILVARLPQNQRKGCSIAKMSRVSFSWVLLKYLVVGKGVAQVKEFFIKKTLRDFYSKLITVRKRLLLSIRMVIKFKPSAILLSYDSKSNVDLIINFIDNVE
jgi:hypothetical protein